MYGVDERIDATGGVDELTGRTGVPFDGLSVLSW
jgi:hypothetical protein